jgi:hypothetical protein
MPTIPFCLGLAEAKTDRGRIAAPRATIAPDFKNFLLEVFISKKF